MKKSKIKFTKEEEMVLKTAIAIAKQNLLNPHDTEAKKRNSFRKDIDKLIEDKVKLKDED